MNVRPLIPPFMLAALLAAGAAAGASLKPVEHETVTPAFAHAIPNIPGKVITAAVVNYKPGGKSISHRHGSAFVVAYVLSGSIRSQLEGGEAKVYHPGESWTEAPGAHHLVSDNASATQPASLLAIFITDSGNTKLVTYDTP
ncbi:cupin domain-containing protein [Rhodanobacter spathiphylli]|uniref:Cupin n=1 Tax=Rhodanobacter spathiphylli B39 TaxID=1163407 RepID=I4W4Y6_9GAMM|nr:cupin domain-containing protein [Rhodanobacter spathiphylli]EIL94527.1 cupin [Rhodanobacter spathiphylli B39]